VMLEPCPSSVSFRLSEARSQTLQQGGVRGRGSKAHLCPHSTACRRRMHFNCLHYSVLWPWLPSCCCPTVKVMTRGIAE
jgi:hypothetical protein